MAGIERPDERQDGIENGLPAFDAREIELKLFAGGPEIEDAIVGERGSEGIGGAVVETKGGAMKGVSDFVAGVSELGKVGGHAGDSKTARQWTRMDANGREWTRINHTPRKS